MNAPLSLSNKTVLVPREKSQAKRFSGIVKKYGGIPVEVPLLAFKPIRVTVQLQEILNKIDTYDWIIFTSRVTVETFFSFWKGSLPNLPKIAAIGRMTAEFINEKGFEVNFIPTEYVAETFALEFSPFIKKGTKVFIPKGNLARDHISNELIKIGAEVDECIVYDTYCPEESIEQLAQLLAENKLDIIPFTSPSTADHFMRVVKKYGLQNKIESCIFAAIGPIAKLRAESLGLSIHIVPSIYTVEDMMKKLVEYVELNK